jgi:hypothetical protein
MSRQRRFRREDPIRTGPIRTWRTLFRPGGLDGASEAPEPEEETSYGRSWDDVVSQGVELGYKVIEEHIRQGQRVAQQVGEGSYGTDAIRNDASELVDRLLHFYTDLGSLCFDLIESVARSPALTRNVFGSANRQDRGNNRAEGASTTDKRTVSIEIASPRPTQVTLDLNGALDGQALAVHELRALDTTKPPLREVAFESRPEAGCPSLRVKVPQGQPPDTYSGTIVDRATKRPLGTVCVHIRE